MHTLVGAVFLCSVAGFLGEVHQGFELASHFRLQYLLAGLAGLLVCVTLHAWWAALGAGVTVVLNLVLVVPWYLPPARAPLTGPQYPVRILLANVEDANHNVAALIRLVIEEDPQVVILQEATELWLERLKVLQERFPYATALPRPGSVGIALYSRLPVERFDVIPLGSRRIPGLLTRLDGGGGGLSVVTVHPRPPLRRHDFRQRNEQLRDTAALVHALPAPKILVGDLNTSLWSPYYARLMRHTGLHNARQGFGLRPTWPAWMPWPFLRIPIDHCLVSPEIQVSSMRTGRPIGSDHLPIVVDLVIPG